MMFSLEIMTSILVDGVALGFILFMTSIGLTIVFGLMDIVNFAHGSIFMLGAFIGYEVFARTGNFFAGLAVAFITMSALGGLIEISLIKRVKGVLSKALVTLGLMLVIDRLVWLIWGDAKYIWTPPFLLTIIRIGGTAFHLYRLFLIGFGFTVMMICMLFFFKTRIGLIVRAGIIDKEMVETLGININNIFTLVFAIGAGLAGLGGAVIVPWQGAYSTLGMHYLVYAFAIVFIGGAGSIIGTLAASIIIGIVTQFMMYYIPYLTEASVFLVLLVTILLKPQGLFRR